MKNVLLKLAERLRQQRKLKGKTQNDLAELLNVRRATYGEVERYNKEKALLMTEAEKLNKKKSQLFDWLEEGIYTKSEFIERKSELTNKILNVNKAIDLLVEPKVDEIKLKSAKLSEVIQSANNPTISVNKKNELLKSVIKRIEYTNTTGTPELDIYFK